MRRPSIGPPARVVGRAGVTVLEVLLASFLLLMVALFLWQALRLVSLGAGKAEWAAAHERELEGFRHVLGEELRRANHLITMDAARVAVHDPRFSAVWVLEEGRGVGFRVFESDQPVADPAALALEELRQDRVFFLLRGREVVYIRRGQLEPDEVRVLLRDVTSLTFRPGTPRERAGLLTGSLAVEIHLLDPAGASRLTREWSLPTSVPVLQQGAELEGTPLLAPPGIEEAASQPGG